MYGPCASCAVELQRAAAERAEARERRPAERPPESEPAPSPRRPTAPTASSYTGPVGHCEYCTKPVYGEAAETEPSSHPCCVFWVETVGFDRCYACQPISGRIPAEPSREGAA
jgi:hypothetical protein